MRNTLPASASRSDRTDTVSCQLVYGRSERSVLFFLKNSPRMLKLGVISLRGLPERGPSSGLLPFAAFFARRRTVPVCTPARAAT